MIIDWLLRRLPKPLQFGNFTLGVPRAESGLRTPRTGHPRETQKEDPERPRERDEPIFQSLRRALEKWNKRSNTTNKKSSEFYKS